jgi:hypothetical protein
VRILTGGAKNGCHYVGWKFGGDIVEVVGDYTAVGTHGSCLVHTPLHDGLGKFDEQ